MFKQAGHYGDNIVVTGFSCLFGIADITSSSATGDHEVHYNDVRGVLWTALWTVCSG